MTLGDQTIAALLTPLAPGAIAVILLLGKSAEEIIQKICCPAKRDQPLKLLLNRPSLCKIIDRGEVLDEAIVVHTKAPIGLSLFELHTHGGVRVVQRVMDLLAHCGVQIVSARELNEAAESAGRIETLIDTHLISAKSIRLAEWLLAQREILPGFMAELDKLDSAARSAFESRAQVAKKLLEGIRIAIIGPPNAGKSTLANCLIGRERIITSDIPGTTRDWVSETALIAGWPVTLTDTAGIRDTSCAIEQESIRRGSEQARQADLVLIILDSAKAQAELLAQSAQCQGLLFAGQQFFLVLNKCDLVGEGDHKLIGELRISAQKEVGITELEQRMAKMLGLDQLRDELPTGVPEIRV